MEKKNNELDTLKKKTKRVPAKKTDNMLTLARKYSDFGLYEDKLITKEQCAFLHVFENNLGNISHAMRSIGLRSRQTYYNWIESNEYFASAISNVKEAQIDVVESKLQENILDGNLIAQMFYLKTIGKSRGYIERVETDQRIETVGFDFEEVK